MVGVTPERITVSENAALRWIERVEGQSKERRELLYDANRDIRSEVADAVREGRKAKRKPRWACRTDFRARMNVPANNLRYAWNETESICFALRRDKDGWFVITLVTQETK